MKHLMTSIIVIASFFILSCSSTKVEAVENNEWLGFKPELSQTEFWMALDSKPHNKVYTNGKENKDVFIIKILNTTDNTISVGVNDKHYYEKGHEYYNIGYSTHYVSMEIPPHDEIYYKIENPETLGLLYINAGLYGHIIVNIGDYYKVPKWLQHDDGPTWQEHQARLAEIFMTHSMEITYSGKEKSTYASKQKWYDGKQLYGDSLPGTYRFIEPVDESLAGNDKTDTKRFHYMPPVDVSSSKS